MLNCCVEIFRLRKGEDRTEVVISARHVMFSFPYALDMPVCYEFIRLNAERLARYELKMAGVDNVMSVRPDANVLGATAMQIVYVTADTKFEELYRVKFQIA